MVDVIGFWVQRWFWGYIPCSQWIFPQSRVRQRGSHIHWYGALHPRTRFTHSVLGTVSGVGAELTVSK